MHVLRRTFDEQRHGLRLPDFFDKGELLLPERVLVHQARPAEDVRGELLDGVLGHTTTDELQPTSGDSHQSCEHNGVEIKPTAPCFSAWPGEAP